MSDGPPLHPIETLYQLLDIFGPHHAGVVPITKHIGGTAFFPGGSGLWGTQPGAPFPPMPIGGVMIVGHKTLIARPASRNPTHAE